MVQYVARPIQHESLAAREWVHSACGDELFRGEPPSEIDFPAEEQRERPVNIRLSFRPAASSK
jgi:hypothetical protein